MDNLYMLYAYGVGVLRLAMIVLVILATIKYLRTR